MARNGIVPASAMAGFTLIEVLIAVAIMSIGFLGFQGFYAMAQSSIQRSTERIQLNLAAQEIMEQIANDAAVGINPTSYAGNLLQCTNLTTKRQAWCDRLKTASGTVSTTTPPTGEARKIDVQSIAGSNPPRYIVTVTLATQGGKVHTIQRRIMTQP